MTTFDGGPATGITLAIRRAPLYLRVVQNAKGDFDALDQLDDTPAANEKLFAYKQTSSRGHVHIKAAKRSASGFYAMATYEFIAEQPEDGIMRDGKLWKEWIERKAGVFLCEKCGFASGKCQCR